MIVRCVNCFYEYNEMYTSCPYCNYKKGSNAGEGVYLNPGTMLKRRYKVGQVIGSGGFGIIYKAWDKERNTVVAVKEFFQSGLVSRVLDSQQIFLVAKSRAEEFFDGKRRFMEEAVRIGEFAGHPNIVSIFDAFEENNTVYQVMEYLQGVTLGTYIEKVNPSIQEKVDIILRIGDAINALHSCGILHRDVSPDNIMIPHNFPQEDVKLFDFGAARFSVNERDSLQTRVMKPGFSPPEQYGPGSKQNNQIDVYALGATLYNILTGIMPEESTNRKNGDKLPSPKALNGEIPETISNAVLTAVALEPHLRFESISEFQKALVSKESVLTPNDKMKRLRKKRSKIILSFSACIIIGFAIIGFLFIREIDSTTLPDSSINLLYPISGDEAADSALEKSLNSIVDDFKSMYPNVTITKKGIAQDEYADEISRLLQRGNYPAVFDSTMLDPDTLGSALDLSSIVGNEERNNCYFLDNYSRHFPDRRRMPTGFTVSALYINRQLCNYDRAGVDDINTLLASMPFAIANRGLSCNDLYIDDFKSVFGSGYSLVGRERFVNDETGAYFSSTSEYQTLLRDMPGRFKLLYVDGESVSAEFNCLWSIMPGSNAEQKAARRFMQYMLSDNAQHFYHIGGQSGLLPVNKQTIISFSEIYVDFSQFFANIENYSVSVGRLS